jgi:hypothetical protein
MLLQKERFYAFDFKEKAARNSSEETNYGRRKIMSDRNGNLRLPQTENYE